jgi:D-alanyl-D-alanine carboxypeptidase
LDPSAVPVEGTLEAQALALATGSVIGAATEPAPGEDQAVGDPALMLASSLLPRARPGSSVPATGTDVAAKPTDAITSAVAAAVAEVAPENVTAEIVVAEASAAESPLPDASAGEMTDIETVAGIVPSDPAPIALAALSTAPKRRAPIFDAVAQVEPAAPVEQEVVVAVSTSGGSNWGVSIDGYVSQVEAEKAMFKLALAESATLNGGLRKVVQKNDGYAAHFLGLSEEQADLACRRLAARAVPCEAIGP